MSGREWKPGDVAMVRAVDKNAAEVAIRSLGLGVNQPCWQAAKGYILDSRAIDARPLVVIDPEDREQVERLADAFCTARWSHIAGSSECDPLTRSSMKEALDAYLAPPKPDEPTGLGAVVEDASGNRWLNVNHPHPMWQRADDRRAWTGSWANLRAVRVLSEGVTP